MITRHGSDRITLSSFLVGEEDGSLREMKGENIKWKYRKRIIMMAYLTEKELDRKKGSEKEMKKDNKGYNDCGRKV